MRDRGFPNQDELYESPDAFDEPDDIRLYGKTAKDILDDLKRGAGPAQRKAALAQIQSLVDGAMPEKTDNHRLYLSVGDRDKTDEQIRLYAQLRQDGHNHAIKEIRNNLKKVGLL